MPEYFAGLDLGQAQDFTALAIAHRREQETGETRPGVEKGVSVYPDGRAVPIYEEVPVLATHYDLAHLERFKLGTAYPTIVAAVSERMRTPILAGHTTLGVDATGVGRPVIDLLRRERLPVRMTPITITGGSTVTSEGGFKHVPKRDLVSVCAVLLQSGRLHIAAKLPEAETLTKELQGFQVKITTAANDIYGAWREGTHDDLVLATALALWTAEHGTRWGVVG